MIAKLEQYRVFKEVADCGNLTTAAQRLYISQSAVSQRGSSSMNMSARR